MKEYIQIYWTSGSLEEARAISSHLVENRLVACASFFTCESVFSWKGKLDTSQEVKVIFKTRAEKFEDVKNFILKHAAYEVPEILKVSISDGYEKYLNWIDESVL